jgi:hypothetical protein
MEEDRPKLYGLMMKHMSVESKILRPDMQRRIQKNCGK